MPKKRYTVDLRVLSHRECLDEATLVLREQVGKPVDAVLEEDDLGSQIRHRFAQITFPIRLKK